MQGSLEYEISDAFALFQSDDSILALNKEQCMFILRTVHSIDVHNRSLIVDGIWIQDTFLLHLIIYAIRSPDIDYLRLSRVHLDDSSIDSLMNSLENSRIRILDLSFNLLTETGARRIAEKLPKTNIEKLNIIGNEIPLMEIREIRRAVRSLEW